MLYSLFLLYNSSISISSCCYVYCEISYFESFLFGNAGLPHLRREDLGVGQEVMSEHFDDEVELTQVLTLLCDFKQ